MRATALLAVVLMLTAAALPACAEALAFGGRGEDALYEAVAADAGFFAVGTTASSDGDLQARTRSGETGWALRVGGDGQPMWSFCSGKSGMYTMTAPHVYADGRFSLVLTDEERQRGEWIVLDSRGGQEYRVAIPKLSALCPQGEEGTLLAMQPAIGSTGPYLMLLISHEGAGELCASALLPDGGVHACGTFYGDSQSILIPGQDGAVYVGAELGAIAVTRLAPGMAPETRLITLEDKDEGVAHVTDALVDSDGSLLLAVQTVTANQQCGTQLMRVSTQGEILFARSVQGGMLDMLTRTDEGYAALLDGKRIIFLDGDGMQLGQVNAPDGTLALLSAGGGVYALTHDPERGRRQAVFTRIDSLAALTPALMQENAHTPSPESAPPRGGLARLVVGEGYLRCESVYGGVNVTRVDGAGAEVWQTRIPIHTAADRLVFEWAQTEPDGDILLYGHYETDLPEGMLREGAQVRLNADGVLKEIGTMQ